MTKERQPLSIFFSRLDWFLRQHHYLDCHLRRKTTRRTARNWWVEVQTVTRAVGEYVRASRVVTLLGWLVSSAFSDHRRATCALVRARTKIWRRRRQPRIIWRGKIARRRVGEDIPSNVGMNYATRGCAIQAVSPVWGVGLEGRGHVSLPHLGRVWFARSLW